MSNSSSAESLNFNFTGAFNGAYASIGARLEAGARHRLEAEFRLPERDYFDDQRDQLKDLYDEFLDHDRDQDVRSGIKLVVVPPTNLLEYAADLPEEDPDKYGKPLVEKFMRDFSGTTVKGLGYLTGISDKWELAITQGDFDNSRTTHRRSQRPIDFKEEVDALPKNLRQNVVDLFPTAYAGLNGLVDRYVSHDEHHATILVRGKPRLLAPDELQANLNAPHTALVDAPSKIAFGHYQHKGSRTHGGSFEEAEIIISGKRPVYPPEGRRTTPYLVRRRLTIVSKTA